MIPAISVYPINMAISLAPTPSVSDLAGKKYPTTIQVRDLH